jgi:SpoVK/Ycf46/Vps4 family AAA+-type ATPase
VIQTLEAVAPCVAWVDELDKGFAGSQSSGSTDSGTTARVMGSILSWMAEKTAQVFLVATANNVDSLPPEMLRRGRFDAIYFMDLPNTQEREAIWKIQVAKHGRKPAAFDLKKLAAATPEFTGSEIESVFVDSLFNAFAKEEEPTTESVIAALAGCIPLARTAPEKIAAMRNWQKGRAILASRPEALKSPAGRKLSA